jgi:hypothetical protein
MPNRAELDRASVRYLRAHGDRLLRDTAVPGRHKSDSGRAYPGQDEPELRIMDWIRTRFGLKTR